MERDATCTGLEEEEEEEEKEEEEGSAVTVAESGEGIAEAGAGEEHRADEGECDGGCELLGRTRGLTLPLCAPPAEAEETPRRAWANSDAPAPADRAGEAVALFFLDTDASDDCEAIVADTVAAEAEAEAEAEAVSSAEKTAECCRSAVVVCVSTGQSESGSSLARKRRPVGLATVTVSDEGVSNGSSALPTPLPAEALQLCSDIFRAEEAEAEAEEERADTADAEFEAEVAVALAAAAAAARGRGGLMAISMPYVRAIFFSSRMP